MALVLPGAVGCNTRKEPPPAPAASSEAAPEPVKPSPDPSAPPDVTAAPADAEKTGSGLASRLLAKGTGTEHPRAEDTVKVHYTGWTTNGVKFDSSVDRGQPMEFPLGSVIKGWTEGLQLMVPGEKRRFWIPATLAYGDTPIAPRGPRRHAGVRRRADRDQQAPEAPRRRGHQGREEAPSPPLIDRTSGSMGI